MESDLYSLYQGMFLISNGQHHYMMRQAGLDLRVQTNSVRDDKAPPSVVSLQAEHCFLFTD